MNSDITELGELDADEIVIATGGTAKRLPVPGGEKCVSIEDALRGRFKLGDDIVIIGGGLAGCELAYDLAVKGNRPAIIEAQDDLIRGMNVSAPNSVLMRDLLRFHEVPAYLESRVLEVQDGRVVFENAEGRHELEADSVVNAIGFAPGSALCPKKQKHIHIIGDAASVSNLKNAIWGANDLAVALSR